MQFHGLKFAINCSPNIPFSIAITRGNGASEGLKEGDYQPPAMRSGTHLPAALCLQDFICIELQELWMVGAQLQAEFRVPLTVLILEAVVLGLSQIWRTGSKGCFASPGHRGIPVL